MMTPQNDDGRFVMLPAGTRPRILLIDDNKGFVELIRHWLGPRYDLLVASDGATGVEMAATLRPHVILLDVMMPRMSGLEVLRLIREKPDLTQAPVIVVTAYAEMREATEIAALRPWLVLHKPFSPAILVDAIEAILSSKAPPPEPGAEEAFRLALAQELAWEFESDDLELVETIDGRYPPPPRVHGCSPDVVAFDRRRELLHLGIVETEGSLGGPLARMRLRELSSQEMGEGSLSGTRLPLSIMVPKGLEAQVLDLLKTMKLEDRYMKDIFILGGEGGE